MFKSIFQLPEPGKFVLNVLVSAQKWDSYPVEEIDAVTALTRFGLRINRIEIPDSGKQGEKLLAVHIAWEVDVK
jgi:hypothetical protein